MLPKFSIKKASSSTHARLGLLETAHGLVETPAFMPVGTRGAVKTLTTKQLEDLGILIWLANSYHLMLRPGLEIIEQAGGLHAFTGWQKPLVSDSGGFQIFSQPELNCVGADKVLFRSYIDGSSHLFGPKESMRMQKAMGADLVMCFDHYGQGDTAALHTISWAKVCRESELAPHQSLFAIIQGGKSVAMELVAMDFQGYAIGGALRRDVSEIVACLPEEKPRYLMGTGSPRDIIEAVLRGIDLFDCVLPTRNGRRGIAYTWQGRLQLKSAKFSRDFSPLDSRLVSDASHHSKAYLRHLLNINEFTGLALMTIQNLAFYMDFMKEIRSSIRDDTLPEFYKKVCALYP